MPISGRLRPAVVKTSMIPSFAMMALETSWRMAASISSGERVLLAVFLARAERTAWKKAMSS